jgi:tetratricopeptide (TPR) repeat protein
MKRAITLIILSTSLGFLTGELRSQKGTARLVAECLHNLGNECQFRENYWGSLLAYSLAIQFDSEFGPSYVARANQRVLAHDYKLALSDANQAIRLGQSHPWGNEYQSMAYYDRASANEGVNDFDAAIYDCTIGMEINPKFRIPLLQLRAEVHRLKRQWKAAQRDANEIVRTQPDNAYGWFERAMANYSLGDIKTADEDRQKYERLKLQWEAEAHQWHFRDGWFDRRAARVQTSTS